MIMTENNRDELYSSLFFGVGGFFCRGGELGFYQNFSDQKNVSKLNSGIKSGFFLNSLYIVNPDTLISYTSVVFNTIAFNAQCL